MTSELIPQDGKGLRDFSRKKPKEAFEFLISNLSIWSEVAKLDPFDSADIIEELETSEAVLLLENLETTTNVKLFESLRPRAIIEIAQEMNESLVQKIFEEMDSEAIVDVFEKKTEHLLGYARTEYHCKKCGGHHGHICEDGPNQTGKRYCNNGVCLVFKLKN